MNKTIAIKQLFPNAQPLIDFTVMDNGEGSFIAEWNLPDPQPTDTELQAAWANFKPPEPELSDREKIKRLETENAELKKSQTDLFFELMVKGVL